MAVFYATTRLFLTLLLILIPLGMGARVRQAFHLKERFSLLEKLLLDTALGVGIIGYIFWVFGLINLYYSSAINILTALFMIVAWGGLTTYRQELVSLKRPRLRVKVWQWLAVIALAYFVVFNFIGALGIETKFDSLWYHLSEARVYLMEHSIHLYYPSIFGESASGPRLAEIIYSWGMHFLPGAGVAKLLHFFAGVGLLAGVFALGKRYFGAGVGLLAGLFIYNSRIVGWLSQTAYIDLFTAFFFTVAIILLFRFWQNRQQKILLLASIVFGLALATKMQALMILPAVAGLVFWRTRSFKSTLIALAPAVLIVLPWYLENYLVGGSPFIPITQATPGVEHLGGASSIWEYAFSVHPRTFLPVIWRNMALAFPLVSLGALGLLVSEEKKEKRRILLALTIFGLAGVVLWTYVPVHDHRYLLPFLPTLAVAGAVSALYFARRSKILAVSFGGLIILVVSIQMLAVFYLAQVSFEVVFGKTSREQAKRQAFAGNIWTYYPQDARLKEVVGQGKAGTIIQHNFYNDFPWIDVLRFQPEYAKITSYQQLKDFFKSKGISHLVFRKPYHLGTILGETAIPNASPDEFKKIIKQVYGKNLMEAYSLAD